MSMQRGIVAMKLLELADQDPIYRDVLAALADGLGVAIKRIDEARATGNEDWAEIVIDDECDVIENLLGAAFIVCQTQITAVVSRALYVRKACFSNKGVFASFSASKVAVRALGPPLGSAPALPKVEVLWALANYFKHREEWDHQDWSTLPQPSKTTVDVIKQIGLTSGSTGNLRKGAAVLGNKEFVEISAFADIIDEWSAVVLAACHTELSVK